jgi:hypothetical protein
MEKILIIGAFDRYNYGDLLFPLIIEQQLSTYAFEAQFEYFGLVQSDLTNVGGVPTQNLQAFYDRCNGSGDPVHVIVAGGEALGVTWHSLYSALNPLYARIHKHHVKLSKVLDLNGIAKTLLGGKTTLPFAFTPSDFAQVKSVILNSLGGSGLQKAQFHRYPFLKEKLQQADYHAVRDQLTVDNLRAHGVQADLMPDSAILMSEFYPLLVLEKRVTDGVRDYVESNKGRYVFFQINKKTTTGKEKIIAAELDKIVQEGQTDICLCPIGKALNHDDHIALAAVRKLMQCLATYFDADNIWDIMYLIANAKAYIGTSLHGAITALSFAVPHVGLKVEKLDAYLSTWGVAGNDFAVDFDRIFQQYQAAIAIDQQSYEQARTTQTEAMKRGFDKMAKLLMSR